jgi:hypothetical protein
VFEVTPVPEWVARQLGRVTSKCVGEHGLLVTSLDSSGKILDPEPLVADFGDALPFLACFGMSAFVVSQLEKAQPFLRDGLYERSGRTALFFNHDWLLCLIELSNTLNVLQQAKLAISRIVERFFVKNFLLDSEPTLLSPRTWLGRASPFNMGYIELFLELQDPELLSVSRRVAHSWCNTDFFKNNGLFRPRWSILRPSLEGWISIFCSGDVLLFKDNTNAAWSLIALCRCDRNGGWEEELSAWVNGFESHFWNKGDVYLQLDKKLCGRDISLKAAFSSIDLLCDAYLLNCNAHYLGLAGAVADRWLDRQWTNGLFPASQGLEYDHLDANVDMAVSLLKLGGLTGDQRYSDSSHRCKNAVLKLHESENGYVLSIYANGNQKDRRIIVKYQTLLLKLALLPSSAESLLNNFDVLRLLRDR